MRVFFDTSAFVKRFVEEVGSGEVEITFERASALGLSIICFPEIISALNRKVRNEVISEEEYKELKEDILEDIEDAEIINLEGVQYSVSTEFTDPDTLPVCPQNESPAAIG